MLLLKIMILLKRCEMKNLTAFWLFKPTSWQIAGYKRNEHLLHLWRPTGWNFSVSATFSPSNLWLPGVCRPTSRSVWLFDVSLTFGRVSLLYYGLKKNECSSWCAFLMTSCHEQRQKKMHMEGVKVQPCFWTSDWIWSQPTKNIFQTSQQYRRDQREFLCLQLRQI